MEVIMITMRKLFPPYCSCFYCSACRSCCNSYNTLAPDPTSGTNAPAPALALALDQTVGPTAMSLLFCEQLR
ncbi:UNVERIFIED_CONTAM: hypothetical protein Slati_2401600 [Sesamum latifolium]|uniref:Uncharacterized protein n=1 Tax=Sesamum latifolium TaxID=2727402 RepID=A0AAW2WEJ7_9LAMI